MKKVDVAVIGGGIVGCATAYQLINEPALRSLVILEKESEIAQHQSGRNSGVIHSGIYYRPGSQKAETCRMGRKQLIAFCEAEGIAYDLCGKVIVATRDEELDQLRIILERGIENGVNCGPIDVDRLREIEPAANGVAAINVPGAGIVDYATVSERLAERCRERGFQIETRAEVVEIVSQSNSTVVKTTGGDYDASLVVNCAGLHSDRVARMSGVKPDMKIIPFRGVFYELRPEARHLCKGLIYPVPDPSYPFLGIHLTKTIDGGVECGPNAVLASGREGYSFFSGSVRDSLESLAFPGFQKLATRHWRKGVSELMRSSFKSIFLKEAQKLVPDLAADDLIPARSGIRAQAVARSGDMVDDFVVLKSGRVINVCNAPSPAATACLQIGQRIAENVQDHLT